MSDPRLFVLLLLLSCRSPSDLDCALSAVDWVDYGGMVRACHAGRCDVVTAAGCEVRLVCFSDGSVRRSGQLPTVCPGGTVAR